MSWAYTGGDYLIAVVGERLQIAERAKFGCLDDLSRLLRADRRGYRFRPR